MAEIPGDVAAAVQKWSADIDAALKANKCPKCSAEPVTRTVDERQAGPTLKPGVWVKYRCGNCDYTIACVE